jgi:hypothetical protein
VTFVLQIFGMGTLIDRAPEINWCSVSPDGGQPEADIFANAVLANARLTERDRELFELLELGTHHQWVTPGIQGAFNQLMRPGNISELGPQRFIEWVEYLTRFVPPYDPRWAPVDYDKAGYSRPLTAFYVVARRSDFWAKRFYVAHNQRVAIDALHPDPVTLFFDPSSRKWDESDFVARKHELSKFAPYFGGRQLIAQLETMTRVVAIVIPPLNDFLTDYDAWEDALD